MIIKKADANQKEKESMKITEYKINKDYSGSLIEIDGKHRKIKSLKDDRIYFILEGEGKFIIDNKETNVAKYDLIFIPKNTPYDIIGKMKYFLICSPKIKPEEDIRLE